MDDAAPSPNGAAEAAGQFAALAQLPLRLRDLGVLGLVEHLAGNDAIRLDPLVTGAQEGLECLQLPKLVGEPGQHHGFDGREVARLQLHAGAGAQCSTRDVAKQRQRIAEGGDAGAIACPDAVDHRQGQGAFVLLHILQLRSEPGPAAGCAAIHAQCPAHAIVGWRRVTEHALILVDAGAGRVEAEFEQLANEVIRLAGEHPGHRALVQRRHGVAAGVDCREEPLDLAG